MSSVVEASPTSITVFVPLEVRRRNGRPKIVLPDDGSHGPDGATNQASATVVRAIARAWDWRQRLESGEVATLQDIADAEKVTLPFVSRRIRLAYLSPAILERLVVRREAIAGSLDSLAAAAPEPWTAQPKQVYAMLRQ